MILLQTLIVVLILWCIYILPGIVAIARDHPDKIAILMLNILLGWTLLGWIIAMVWGLRRTAPPRYVPAHHPGGRVGRDRGRG